MASKRILRGGHAEHVHAHCDCQFAIRHDGKSNVSGYNPDKYYQMYKNAEGNSPKEKIKSLRRELEDRDLINAQKRENYANKNTPKMNLQLFADVPDGKLKNYALNPSHSTGKNKAKVFKSALGYDQSNYKDLKQKILDNFNDKELKYKGHIDYGDRYEQVMSITGPNGNTVDVTTAWIKETPDSEARLVSVYIED